MDKSGEGFILELVGRVVFSFVFAVSMGGCFFGLFGLGGAGWICILI